MPETSNYLPVTLAKRLLAIIYDLLLQTAVFFVLAVVMSTLTTFILNDGNAITKEHPYYLLNQIIILCTLFVSSLLFHSWFWMHGGQTLGMKTWRIKLVSNNATNLSWKQAITRYFAALLSWSLLGMGFLWCLFNENKRSWHDILSDTYLIQLKKE